MNLSLVSQTAILTLIARVVAAERSNSSFTDPVGVRSLQRLAAGVPDEERRWIAREKRSFSGIQADHAIAGARRAQYFDTAAVRFIASHPHCAVVNLGCGFDTRFWRIPHDACRYVEVDLPEVIALKREILPEAPPYELIGCSVLDAAWLDQVTAGGNSNCLLLAEGLIMWLNQGEVRQFFGMLSQRLTRSELVLDTVAERYTRGVWKQMLRLATRLTWGLDVVWVSGIRETREIESYAPGVKLLNAMPGATGPIVTVAINP